MTGLRVALLTYRGFAFSGGQGVYIRQLSRALTALGHRVEVFSGQPYPELDAGVPLTRLESLDLFRPEDPFRPARRARDWIDGLELAAMSFGPYPEPLTFSLRAWRELRRRAGEFDVAHDNQALGYGLLAAARTLPVVATIHHPVTVDRRLELTRARGAWRAFSIRRWYGFAGMQARVARRLPRLITVSGSARVDIERDFGVPRRRVTVVPLGVDTDVFRPGPGPRDPCLVVATVSSEAPGKDLPGLLRAFAQLRSRTPARLVVVGPARTEGPVPRLVGSLGLAGAVEFAAGLDDAGIAELYGRAALAVVPSLYEGFSLPAIEAMACGVPLVATTAGSLPEVVGGAARLVAPGDPAQLAGAMAEVLADSGLQERLAAAGRRRAEAEFSWRRTAVRTADVYRAAIEERG